MAAYWPFFFCVFMDRDKAEVHKLTRKERGQYPAFLTEQAWSIKDLLYGFRGNFSSRIQRVVPTRQDGYMLLARVANHIARFGLSFPLARGASHIIKSGNAHSDVSIAISFSWFIALFLFTCLYLPSITFTTK